MAEPLALPFFPRVALGADYRARLERFTAVLGAELARREAEVELVARGRATVRFDRRAPGTLTRLCAELEAWTCDAPGARASAVAAFDPGGSLRGVARFVWLGDPFAFLPRAFFEACERVPARHVLHLCAPHELVAPMERAIEWRDAESERALAIALDAETRGAYARELEACLAGWSDAARRHGARHASASSAAPFEDLARAALGA